MVEQLLRQLWRRNVDENGWTYTFQWREVARGRGGGVEATKQTTDGDSFLLPNAVRRRKEKLALIYLVTETIPEAENVELDPLEPPATLYNTDTANAPLTSGGGIQKWKKLAVYDNGVRGLRRPACPLVQMRDTRPNHDIRPHAASAALSSQHAHPSCLCQMMPGLRRSRLSDRGNRLACYGERLGLYINPFHSLSSCAEAVFVDCSVMS